MSSYSPSVSQPIYFVLLSSVCCLLGLPLLRRGMPLVAGASGEENVGGGDPDNGGGVIDGGETLAVTFKVFGSVVSEDGAELPPARWSRFVGRAAVRDFTVASASRKSGVWLGSCGVVGVFAPHAVVRVRLRGVSLPDVPVTWGANHCPGSLTGGVPRIGAIPNLRGMSAGLASLLGVPSGCAVPPPFPPVMFLLRCPWW